MPPKVRFSREVILQAALELTRKSGIEALNARSLARELGCSTQPLFHVFESMEDIRRQVYFSAREHYSRQILESAVPGVPPYKATGMAYIRYAYEHPELFKLLFMQDRTQIPPAEENEDSSIPYVLEQLMRSTGLSYEHACSFHAHLWNYVHGVAAMVATRFISYDPNQVDRQLSEIFQAVKCLYGLAPQLSENEKR